MTDETQEARSAIMRAIRSKDTAPEMIVRRTAHALGYRFRLHKRDLPGKPDLVFPGRRKVIFVHGCFWHQHQCPTGGRIPSTNRDFWIAKFRKNKSRDARNQSELRDLGWQVLVIWECELHNQDALAARIKGFLN